MTLVVPRQVARQIIKPIARQLIPSLGKKSLDIRAKVGTSTSPTSTGTKAVTGVGFQPKVVLPFGTGVFSNGVGSDLLLGLGAGLSSSNRAAIAVSSVTSVTTSNTDREHLNNLVYRNYYNSGPYLGSDLTSLDVDGFTLNWATVQGVAAILNHIALGGADLEVSLVQCQMNGTNAAQSFAHGLSGAPTGVLFFGCNTVTAPANTSADLFLSMGAWASSGQFNAALASATGVTTTVTRRMLSTAGVMSLILYSTLRQMAVSSVDATNVNCTYPVTLAADTQYFWMLCIRGAKCQVGTFDCNGSTSPLTITTTGITPKLFLPVFVPVGVDSIGTVQNALALTVGASDGTNNVSCGITDKNAVTTTSARRYQSSTTLAEYDVDGIKSFEGSAAFSGESVVLTPTTNVSTAFGQGGYLILGS